MLVNYFLMMLTFIRSYRFMKFSPIILVIGLFLFSCSGNQEKKTQDDVIIAKVGDKVITAKDFKASFEFSFAPFRQGPNPRKTYLNYLIKELLIANEGYAQGFNNSRYVKTRVANRLNNNLLQAFYTKYVHGKVNIPDKEIEEATKKATIKFRMMIWELPTLYEANKAYSEAKKSNLVDYVQQQISKLEIKNVRKEYFETDWLDYLDLRPELLAEIQNLEIGKTSKPIPFGDGYALFQVLGINREPIKSDELKYGARRKRIEARLFNIQSDSIVHKLMDSLLTPLDVRAKGRVIEEMVQPLFQWIATGLPEYGSLVKNINAATDTSQFYLRELKRLLPKTLVKYSKGTITVEDYFNYMNYHRRIIDESRTPEELKNNLIMEIGNMIKNGEFIEIAEEEGFQDSANIVHDIQLWETKWTYDAYRSHLVDTITVTKEEMKSYFKNRWKELPIANVDTTRFYKYENDVYNAILYEKQMKYLNKELAELKKKYPVWINEEALNKLELNDGPKSSEISLFVTKNFSGEKVVPDADLKWIHF